MQITAKDFDELTVSELYEIIKSRAEIFTLEQNIICQDLDDMDYCSLHIFCTDNKRITAYLRAFYKDEDKTNVRVGRVLTLKHGTGLGKVLMTEAISEIKRRMPCEKITINAQKYATGFYEKFGFRVVSDDFLEEGVVHVAMELKMN